MSSDDKREQILIAAKQIFARYGYKKTTVNDIGDAVGMTKSNLYFYFTNKNDLYNQVIRFSMLNWYREIEQAAEEGRDHAEKLINASRMAFSYLSKDEQLCAIIAHDKTIFPFSSREDRFLDVNSQTLDLYVSIIEEGQRSGQFRMVDPLQTAQLLFSIITVLIIQSYVKQDGVGQKQFAHAVDILIKGLSA